MNQTLILTIIDIIENHLPQPISVSDIAKQCGYSRSYIQHQFKAATGYTLTHYQRSRALSIAANRLAEGKHRVLDVAIELGFESQEAFARAFRQHSSVAPSHLLGRNVWAERMYFPRLGANQLAHLSTLQTLPLTLVNQPETRWGCYVFTVDSSQRDIKVITDAINLAHQSLMLEPYAEQLNFQQMQILEFRQHNQEVSSTYPLSIGIPFTNDDVIPNSLLEIRLPTSRLISVSLPNPNYVPTLFYTLYQRLYNEHQHYFGGLPAFWNYDPLTGQLHHKCRIEPCNSIDFDPIAKWFAKENELTLDLSLVPLFSDSIPNNKRAGTRRLTTLLNDLLGLLQDTPINVAFHTPTENKDSQYQYSVSSTKHHDIETRQANAVSCKGTYLSTQWSGDDVWQLEHQLEQFYLRLSQHKRYKYRAAPEIFQQLSFNNNRIEFELLTPIELCTATRQKSVWMI